ncbi:MAG: OmpW family outer membrane protein [Ignavibacteriota bacterium]
MSRFFTKLILSVFVIIGIARVSFAQEDANMPHPLTKSGSAAFLFNLAGIGTFGLGTEPIGTATQMVTQNGVTFTANNQTIGGLGLKYYIADDMALKVLLAFGTTSNGDTATRAFSTSQFGIAAIFEYHMRPLYSTSPYIGGGVRFGTASQTAASGTTSEVKASGTVLNIGIVAGFDWFFTKGIAIGAEYGLGFTTWSSSTTLPSPLKSPDFSSASSIGIGLNGGGSVHALVYF